MLDNNLVAIRKQPICNIFNYNLVEMPTFGDWLRDHRKKLGLLQSDVAKRAKVSTSYISTLERGQKHSITGAELTPEREKVIAIAKAVEGDVNEALDLCDYKPINDALPAELHPPYSVYRIFRHFRKGRNW